jgi:hypothetical protein
MDARRPHYVTPVRLPLRVGVKLAVRVLGPGPLRLRIVKFGHELDSPARPAETLRQAV